VINLVDLPLENKARVEVLKGVGALYYGFAPPSGIVNLVTKRPTDNLTARETARQPARRLRAAPSTCRGASAVPACG
jgi:outer membrane receptor protein involved in Fe transport